MKEDLQYLFLPMFFFQGLNSSLNAQKITRNVVYVIESGHFQGFFFFAFLSFHFCGKVAGLACSELQIICLFLLMVQ